MKRKRSVKHTFVKVCGMLVHYRGSRLVSQKRQAMKLDCGHATIGHGTIHGRTLCYPCCTDHERKSMIETGRADLYLTKGVEYGWIVSNWTGLLKFRVTEYRESKHGGGFGSSRSDAWFVGPDGKRWHAVRRGDMDLCRCRRLKND